MPFALHPSTATRNLRAALGKGTLTDAGLVASDYIFAATPIGGDASASARARVTASGQKAASGSASMSARATVTASGFGPIETHSGSASISARPRVTASGATVVTSTAPRSAMMV